MLARTLTGAVSLGSFTFLTGAFNRSRAYIEKILSGFNDISEQAVFLNDLFEFFAWSSTQSLLRRDAIPAPRPIRRGTSNSVTLAFKPIRGSDTHGNPEH